MGGHGSGGFRPERHGHHALWTIDHQLQELRTRLRQLVLCRQLLVEAYRPKGKRRCRARSHLSR